ncbi:MAG TPA: DUF971 domain-containing protein [Acidobacteriaceae bacterium]|jgi:DUF971 family protein|nr:DUF971 domain-containing protein [Acidobacteriaceae bacterium]
MSHEGIRIVGAEEAAREERQPKLSGDAIRPAKVRIDKTGGTGMTVEWRDGHSSHWGFAWLRAACPCATCHEQREAEGRLPGVAKAKPASLLPMYEAPPRPVDVEPVGRYALRFHWNDGHEAGLYSWDYLRNVCDVEARKQQQPRSG